MAEQSEAGKLLDSWKEIASHLNRHVTTVRRWEKQEDLPVHRHLHAKLGSVYAYTNELDRWLGGRRAEDATSVDPPTSEPTPGRLPPPPSLVRLPSWTVDLLGRDGEIEVLDAAWAAASAKRQQLVVIAGQPGVGKTRLALEFARSVAPRSTVLVGRCDREALVPFAPFVEMLQWLVRVTPAPALRRCLTEIEGSVELAQIAPEITRRVHLPEDPVPATLEGRRFRMFEAFAQLIVLTSRDGPILMVFEDAHWADQGSMLFLRHLVRSTRDAPVCIVVTCREDEREAAARAGEILEDLRREASATIALAGLSELDVRRFIRSWTGRETPPWLASFVVRNSEGNPLFVTEMLRHLDDSGRLTRVDGAEAPMALADVGVPGGIRELIGRRLAGLTDTTRSLLTFAAVAGREFGLSVVEALARLSEDAVLDGMDEALAARIVTEEPGAPGSFSFTHTLIRETLYGGISAARRVRLHHRVGAALEEQCAPADPPLRQLAYHFGQAAAYKDADKAALYAVRAGDQAGSALALEDAARYYDIALRSLDFLPAGPESNARRVDLHRRRGRILFQAGQWAPAKTAFEAAISLLAPLEDEKRCELLVRLAEASFWLMDVPALRTFAGEAQTLADKVGRDDLWADAVAWLGSARVAAGDVLGGIESDRRAVARAGGITSFALARVPLTLYWAGRTRQAVESASEGVERARASADPAFLLYALQHQGLSLSGAGKYDGAVRAFDEARAFGRHCGAFPLLARATSMSVAPLLSLGDLDGALERAMEARELAHRVAFEPPLVSAGIDLLLIFARSREPGRAEPLLGEIDAAVQRATGWHAWKWNLRVWQARAELAYARGSWAESVSAATKVVQQSRARHRLKYEALGLMTRARARHRLGSRLAIADARRAADVARRLSDPAVLIECLGVLLEVEGSDALLAEARKVGRGILDTLPPGPLRRAFVASASSRLGDVQ